MSNIDNYSKGGGGGGSLGLFSFLSNKKGESYKAKYYRFGFTITVSIVFLVCGIIVFNTNDNNNNYNGYSNYEKGGDESNEVITKDFKVIATQTGTDKVAGYMYLPKCLADKTGNSCTRPNCIREECKTWGHFYDTIYNQYLGKYSLPSSPPIQLLEIGYFNGKGFEAYTKMLDSNPKHELHSMEISCIEHGPRSEGKWPWGNFAEVHQMYPQLLKNERLHCGDASQYSFLKSIWDTKMKRTTTTNTNNSNTNNSNSATSTTSATTNSQSSPPPPPLMVVIDDGAHLTDQMTTSLFFWIPRLEPGGILIMEDIQPIVEANKFRTHILPQVMKDIHWCGGEITGSMNKEIHDEPCFPQIQSFIASIHCEMHICVFIRNNKPSYEASEEDSIATINAFSDDTVKQCLFG